MIDSLLQATSLCEDTSALLSLNTYVGVLQSAFFLLLEGENFTSSPFQDILTFFEKKRKINKYQVLLTHPLNTATQDIPCTQRPCNVFITKSTLNSD